MQEGWKFNLHLEFLCNKVKGLCGKLVRIMRTDWGLRSRSASIIYDCVFIQLVTYAAPVWFEEVMKIHFRRKLFSLQRFMLLTMTRCCRTVSNDALQVIAGKMPLDLAIVRTGLNYCIKKNKECSCLGIRVMTRSDEVSDVGGWIRREIKRVQEELIQVWQDRWLNSENGRTTFEFIPDVLAIDTKMHKWKWPGLEMSFFITGHGPFKASLNRFGLADENTCFCGAVEDWKHILYDCTLYNDLRSMYIEMLRDVNLKDLINNEVCFVEFSNLCSKLCARKRVLSEIDE